MQIRVHFGGAQSLKAAWHNRPMPRKYHIHRSIGNIPGFKLSLNLTIDHPIEKR